MGFEDLKDAASRLSTHPQDHGWREFFSLLDYGLEESAGELPELLTRCMKRQPAHSPTHLINLFGIALKSVAPDSLAALRQLHSPTERLPALRRLLDEHGEDIVAIVCDRRNSFTGARRFLVPQVILAAYFAKHEITNLGFADFGTGLGIMPRQLNSKRLYETFSPELPWPDGIPTYRPVHIERGYGVDRGPMPDLEWVAACYGTSTYYDGLFTELKQTLEVIEKEGYPATYHELDLLDAQSMTAFLRRHPIHAANLSYVLYEVTPAHRLQILDVLRREMRPPRLIIVTEPHAELTRQGCDVLVYCDDRSTPYHLCTVSDGHFKGEVTALRDYPEFMARYPIKFNRI